MNELSMRHQRMLRAISMSLPHWFSALQPANLVLRSGHHSRPCVDLSLFYTLCARMRLVRQGMLGIVLIAFAASVYALTRGRSEQVGIATNQLEAADPAKPLRIVLGTATPGRYDAGKISRGGRMEVPFVMLNSGKTAVTVGSILTSCDCLRIELSLSRVEAGAEVGGRAIIDLTHESDFVGGLVLEAEAPAVEDGRPVFALKLSIEVK
jgi:hypothetical protein